MELRQALELMKTRSSNGIATVFKIEWITLDLSRNTGGEWRVLEKAIKVKSPRHYDSLDIITVRAADNNSLPININMRLIMRINGERII